MLYEALNIVVKELNRYLTKKFDSQDDKVVLGTILNETGSVPEENRNKIIFSLINLENDKNVPFNPIYIRSGEDLLKQDQPMNFNLDVMITSLFTNYNESLKFLSEVIYFFQTKNVFDHENTPGLDHRIKYLTFEIITLTYHEAHSLWGALGAKYMPSILWKIRVLSYTNDAGQNEPVILETTEKVLPDN